MRIHGLCIVKDESDIIRQGLSAARAWCDAIYVFDNGSADGTWEIVRSLAERDPAIVPWKQDPVPFRDGLRADIYNNFADRAEPGDWWVRLDPDEFYVENPREFLSKVPSSVGCVWHASLQYYFSTEEARRYREDPAQFGDDVPVEEKCHYYFNHWSEIRFVRHEVMDPWVGKEDWPEGLTERSFSYHRRILCRHFSYRSPQQIERRIKARAESILRESLFRHESFKNWRKATLSMLSRKQPNWNWKDWETLEENESRENLNFSWESRVIEAELLEYDAHDGNFVVNESIMPTIRNMRYPLPQRLMQTQFMRSLKRHVKPYLKGLRNALTGRG